MRWLLLVCAVGLLAACSEATGGGVSPFEVRITGDAQPATFAGSVLVTGKDGSVQQESVQGAMPFTYAKEGRSVVATIQKQGTAGSLKVEIVKGDKVVKSGETTADYGVVTVSSQ